MSQNGDKDLLTISWIKVFMKEHFQQQCGPSQAKKLRWHFNPSQQKNGMLMNPSNGLWIQVSKSKTNIFEWTHPKKQATPRDKSDLENYSSLFGMIANRDVTWCMHCFRVCRSTGATPEWQNKFWGIIYVYWSIGVQQNDGALKLRGMAPKPGFFHRHLCPNKTVTVF